MKRDRKTRCCSDICYHMQFIMLFITRLPKNICIIIVICRNYQSYFNFLYDFSADIERITFPSYRMSICSWNVSKLQLHTNYKKTLIQLINTVNYKEHLHESQICKKLQILHLENMCTPNWITRFFLFVEIMMTYINSRLWVFSDVCFTV